MDQLAGFAKQFTGGNNQNQQQAYGADQAQEYSNQNQGQGRQEYSNQYEGRGQQSNSGAGGFLSSLEGNQGQGRQEYSDQYQGQGQGQGQQSSSSGGGFLSGFGGGQGQGQQQQQSSSGGGGFLGGLGDKFNSAAGGGRESEKNEDYLDKGVDFVQERFMGQGPQDNESAIEQAKDEQISDFIRGKYKSTTGSDFPVQDKETRFG